MSFNSPPPSSDSTVFANRLEAGERLAQAVLAVVEARASTRDRATEALSRFVVYALPRGGIAVAAPIARALHCSLDVIVAKKITRPENPELALGAATSNGHVLWLTQRQSLSSDFDELMLQQTRERAQSQWQQLAPFSPQVDPSGAITLIVDDGIATGMTMAVAAQSLRAKKPAEIWICVPVAPPEILPQLQTWSDRVIVLATPHPFQSVSRFYKEFPQVEMEEAIECLRKVVL
ncbi:phosphoribosyltransferase [Phormidium sp. CLA17]|uniref:phosphoribosyltransferase n=1 Tax=Leptolyngbya sp. Cla-17 TaxID=2803751 RepID=UPI0014909E56|nr:phosphoribosyltransferase family protein [Leptolyngbya sp. Cla-17]MBM0740217.1 phosphoribosyltransferase [Leptolyngbya sp. Cla-17]